MLLSAQLTPDALFLLWASGSDSGRYCVLVYLPATPHPSPTDGISASQILKELGLNLATAGAWMAVTLKETFASLPAF